MLLASKVPKKRVKKPNPPTKRSDLRSGFEFKVLKSLQGSGCPFLYESEKIEYVVPETRKRYIPDFIVTTRSGKKLYIEAKGIFDKDARTKMLYVLQQNPKLDIRILLMRDNAIRKGSRTKYSKWCEDRGVPYAVSEFGNVPEEWLDE